MTKPTQQEKKNWIEKIIRNFCASPANTLENGTGEPAWGEPQIAYARGEDPLFDRVKADIGPFYWTPVEAYRLAYPKEEIAPEDIEQPPISGRAWGISKGVEK